MVARINQIRNDRLKNLLGLRYVSDMEPGYTRRRCGRGFSYIDEKGELLPKADKKRIKDMVIPPLWENVWICKYQNGYLQVTGRDGKKRKQYIYHPDYVDFRQQRKFRKMKRFGERLSEMRSITDRHLKEDKWSKNKILALMVKVLDETGIRIGNSTYLKKNKTYGLTTLRRKHLDFEQNTVELSYKAKSGKYRNMKMDNRKLVRLIRECSELPGYEVFRYRDTDGSFKSVDSSDVNDYIHQHMGDHFSSKDFRTWTATTAALELLEEAQQICSDNPKKKLEPTLVKLVAKKMGNTMSVCREYYIHPQILDLVKKGELPDLTKIDSKLKKKYGHQLEDHELKAIELISDF